jgi:hypothetical protein
MGNNFKMNPGWEKEVERVAKAGFKKKVQPVFDRLTRECNGQPLDEVKAKVAREWSQATGGTITDPDLTAYATAFSQGQRVVLT